MHYPKILSKTFYVVILFLEISIASQALAYNPRVEVDLKVGNIRHIGRYGILLPIYQNSSSILFTNLFFMHDSKVNLEGNFGIGLRHIITKDAILGGYGFWDIRRSKNVNKKIHQLTMGLECLTQSIEVRINGYISQNKLLLTSVGKRLNGNFDVFSNVTVHSVADFQIYEVPLNGFDVEIGRSYPKFSNIQMSVAYFNFFGRNQVNAIRGVRFRTNVGLNSWSAITGELSYGTQDVHYYLGIKLNFGFGKKALTRNKLLTDMNRKMTQMVVRDLDIVSNVVEIKQTKYTKSFSKYVPIILSKQEQAKLGITDVIGNAVFKDGQSAALVFAVQKHGLENIGIIKQTSIDSYHSNLLVISASSLDEDTATMIEPVFADEYDALKVIFSDQNIASAFIQHKNTHGRLTSKVNSIWERISQNSKLEKINTALYTSTFTNTVPNLVKRPVKTYYNGTIVQNVAVMVRYIDAGSGKSYYLFGRRRSGRWAFPGGGVDGPDLASNHSLDVSYEGAALRELKEETGFDGEYYIQKGARLKHVYSNTASRTDWRDSQVKPHEIHIYRLDLGILNPNTASLISSSIRAMSDLTDAKFISRNGIDDSTAMKRINIPNQGWTNLVLPNNVTLVGTNEQPATN